jgi:hypothetical protein
MKRVTDAAVAPQVPLLAAYLVKVRCSAFRFWPFCVVSCRVISCDAVFCRVSCMSSRARTACIDSVVMAVVSLFGPSTTTLVGQACANVRCCRWSSLVRLARKHDAVQCGADPRPAFQMLVGNDSQLANDVRHVMRSACLHCGATSIDMSYCGGCLLVRFCNTDCQRAAWPRHRASCKQEQERLRRSSALNDTAGY